MAQIFHKTFAVNLDEFEFTSASNGTIAQAAGAGLNGTTGGVLMTATGASPSIRGDTRGMPLTGLSATRTAFWMDISSLAIATNNEDVQLWYPRDSAGGARLGSLRMVRLSGANYLRCQLLPDTDIVVNVDVAMTSLPNWVEIETIREVTNGSNDGEMRFYFGGGDYPDTGTQVAEFLTVQNYADFEAVDRTRWGMMFGGASVSGSLKLDELIVVNDNTPILFGVSPSQVQLVRDSRANFRLGLW